jgi:hypothetical protein
MGRESISSRTEATTKAAGKTTRCMERGSSTFPMAKFNTLESGEKMSLMVGD